MKHLITLGLILIFTFVNFPAWFFYCLFFIEILWWYGSIGQDKNRNELNAVINLSRASQQITQGITRLFAGNELRIDGAHRESQAKKDWEKYKDQLYKMIMIGNSSAAMLHILKDYDFNSSSPETYEELFAEIGKWRKKRSYFCVARLLINLHCEQGKFGKIFAVLKECYKTDPDFVLPDSSQVLMLASEAVNQKQHKLAYQIIRDYKHRYNDSQNCINHTLLESQLLWQHLDRQGEAIALLERELRVAGVYEAEKLQVIHNAITANCPFPSSLYEPAPTL